MPKSKILLKDPQKKKKSHKVPILHSIEAFSSTPSLKILTQPSTGRSAALTRDTQSQASSPNTIREELRSGQLSPSSRDSLKIENLLKYSLKRFKNEKLELAKIKEFTELWKNKRKKKIQDYNLNTRIENKCKSFFKGLRPKTAWESPTAKERTLQTPQVLSKHTATSSLERRANIGLEYYQLKSPRNTTPKNLQIAKKSIKPEKPVESKKKITEFIKKKRKERLKKLKKSKELEEENEIKRLAELMKLERKTKQLMKPQKKSQNSKLIIKKLLKKSKSKKSLKKIDEVPEILNKKSFCYSEDEEVQNIMQIRKLSPVDQEVNEGRQCMIFADSSDQTSQNISKDKLTQIAEKRVKSEELSLLGSSSMPIIELKSVSNDTSSDHSEKKQFFQRVESTRTRLNSPESRKKSKSLAKLMIFLKKQLRKTMKLPFNLLKYFKLISLTNSELSYCLRSVEGKTDLKSTKKFELDEMLNKYIQPQVDSEELEKIWERLEFKSLDSQGESNTLKIKERLSECKTQKLFLEPEESTMRQLNHTESKFDLPYIEELSPVSAEKPNFVDWKNEPLLEVKSQDEPVKARFVKKEDIYIQDEGSYLDEKVSNKELSVLSSPEFEEIEEFSSIKKKFFDAKIEAFVNPFDSYESNLSLDEENLIERVFDLLFNDLYLDAVHETAKNLCEKNDLKLVGNFKILVRSNDFFTKDEAVRMYIEQAWGRICLNEVKKLFDNQDLYLEQLGNCRLTPAEHFFRSVMIPTDKNVMDYANIIHNKMIDAFMKFELFSLFNKLCPPPWKAGMLNARKIDFESFIHIIIFNATELCKIASGKIPTLDMIKEDGLIDEDTLQSAREQGLESILAFDIEHDESDWIDYNEEEQIELFNISDFILHDLIEEMQILIS